MKEYINRILFWLIPRRVGSFILHRTGWVLTQMRTTPNNKITRTWWQHQPDQPSIYQGKNHE